MKRFLLVSVVALFLSVIVAACSHNTCPTYSKADTTLNNDAA